MNYYIVQNSEGRYYPVPGPYPNEVNTVSSPKAAMRFREQEQAEKYARKHFARFGPYTIVFVKG